MTVAPSALHQSVPPSLTSLIGREREIADVGALLGRPTVRLITLTGPGGVGKTRIALAVAERMSNAFPAGAFFVSLAAIRDPDLVMSTIAQSLGVYDTGEELIERVAGAIGCRPLLLILDNFEQVLAAAARVGALR